MADRNPLPWFKYETQFIAEELGNLPDIHQGAYHRLIRRLWTRGPLPEEELREEAPESWEAIKRLFRFSDGGISAVWLEKARGYAAGRVSQRSLAGRSSAVKRSSSIRSTRAKRSLKDRSTDVERPISLSISPSLSPSPSDSTSREVQEGMIWPTLDDWWDLYGKKVGWGECVPAWAKLDQRTREEIMAHTEVYVIQNEKKYRKDPIRYLTKRVWKDEVIPKNNGQRPDQQAPEDKFAVAAAILLRQRAGNGADHEGRDDRPFDHEPEQNP